MCYELLKRKHQKISTVSNFCELTNFDQDGINLMYTYSMFSTSMYMYTLEDSV